MVSLPYLRNSSKMKLRKLFFILSCISFLSSSAQSPKWIQVSNPAPRVGDEIVVNLSFDTLMPLRKGHIEEIKNHILKSEVKINTLAMKAGTTWIGPFTFKIGVQEVTTDSIQIFIEEELKTLNDTISIRQVEFQGIKYLVIEQVLVGENTKSKDFFEFDEKNVCAGIELKQSYSSNGTGAKYNFKTLVFQIITVKKGAQECIITAERFNNLPSGLTIKNFMLR